MADSKISALPASTTPLAGTEVLPIVQSSTTVKVSVDNLTAGKSVSGSNFVVTGSSVPTNGMYLATTNTLAWSTNGSERWRIDSSGNLSFTGASVSINNLTNNATMTIGADSGTGAITAIRGASYISLNTYSGGWNECARIGSDGRMLIAATSNQTSYKFQVSSTGNDQISAIGWNQLAEYGAYRTNGASGAQGIVASGNIVMRLAAYGSDGTAYRSVGRIDFVIDGTPGASDMPGRIAFYTTADGAATSTERMRIDNAGKVGIGTTSPTALLNIAAGAAAANSGPLKFTSGTNLTTPEAGAVEYDGTIMTATTDTNFNRATIPLTNYTSGTGTVLTTNGEATLQNLLPAANDTITLSSGTYFLDTSFIVTRGASTTSATARLNILGSGGAAGNFSGISLSAPTAGGTTGAFSFDAVNINVSNVLTAASTTSGGVYTISLRGLLKITTGGTIVPRYNLSANINGAGTISKVLYFRLQQIDTQNAAAFGPAGTGWG